MLMFRYVGILSICTILLFSGCSPERKLARNYVKKHSGSGIMILPLYELYKDNLTISFDTLVDYSPWQLDSIAWMQSVYIRDVSDSVFLTRFTNSLINELSESGFDVYVDGSSDVFLSLPDPKWMIQIAQLMVSEDHRVDFYDLYSIESGETESYNEGYRMNQVSMSSWLEVSRANTGTRQVLFLNGYIQDDFHYGIDLDLMAGNIGMLGNRDSIQIADVYEMAEESGRKHGELLFDYFMNDYIRENLPSGIINREYYHYNRRTKSLIKGLEERFDVVN